MLKIWVSGLLMTVLMTICSTTAHGESGERIQIESELTPKPASDQFLVSIWGPTRPKRFWLGGGFSSDFWNQSYVGGKGILDYLLWSRLTLGLEAGAWVGDTSLQSKRTLASGIRASYQFIPFNRSLRRRPWSLYAGMSCGAVFGAGHKEIDMIDPYVDLHAGARYLISNHWMLFSEITGRNATVGLGLRF
ncbi:hypothetical protein [Sunxiuqinia dokdonensis]|uniref:Outer membrane protein beta-barrel domain-containing protein n=1 Tax=Sunxiuqinia dokdonensis TaxID=1409788 RepID=A0A0L8VEP1_9BACT|nr:hypothetical protein [Sunxiuqinia dokdonensis]KOH46931.1 hypothetical protein NC99_03310 [Sunxiuqinia dokdonensis]